MTAYTEITRRTVAQALGWGETPHKPRVMPNGMFGCAILPHFIEPVAIRALDDLARGLTGEPCNDPVWWPTQDDAQALELCDAVGWELVGRALVSAFFDQAPNTNMGGNRSSIARAVESGLPNRPALLTAAAVIAARNADG